MKSCIQKGKISMNDKKYKSILLHMLMHQVSYIVMALIIGFSGIENIFGEQTMHISFWIIILTLFIVSFIYIMAIFKLEKFNLKKIKKGIVEKNIENIDIVYSEYSNYKVISTELTNLISIAGIFYFYFYNDLFILSTTILISILATLINRPDKNHFEQYQQLFNRSNS